MCLNCLFGKSRGKCFFIHAEDCQLITLNWVIVPKHWVHHIVCYINLPQTVAYPVFPLTTPKAGPPLPNILLKSFTSSSGFSCAAKWPPVSCSDSNTTLPTVLDHLEITTKQGTHQVRKGLRFSSSIRLTCEGFVWVPLGKMNVQEERPSTEGPQDPCSRLLRSRSWQMQ